MGKIKTVELNEEQRTALEQGYREGKSHAFRRRCQMMLLKSEQRTSAEVADILGCCEVVVNSWLKRYGEEGIEGLKTRPGRGRKPILDSDKDLERVKGAVQVSRQRLSLAKAELEAELGKTFSTKTLERYIKNMVLAINASENVPLRSRARKSTGSKSRA
jgi:transposase